MAAFGTVPSATPGTPAQVTPIAVGQTVLGQIASTAQEDEYTFTGTAGQAVYLQAHVSCSGSLGWDLVEPGGGALASSFVCDDLQRVTLPVEGTYTIRVNSDLSATGAYGFTLLAVPATVVTPLTAGQVVTGSIGAPGQWADYTFAGSPGQVVYLQHQASCNGGVLWELRGPSGEALPSTISCHDLGRFALPADGTYTIRLSGSQTAIGEFSFTLLAVPETVVRPIALGQSVSGTLTIPGQWADYTFSGSAGATIIAHATGACVDGLGWQLLGPDGTALTFNVACRDMDAVKLPASGTYTIRIAATNAAIGAYAFTIQRSLP